MKIFFNILFTIYLTVILTGCANQQMPSGGDDDKVPPRIKYLYPKPNTTNFSGDEITIQFDEYVDRRSFIDAFFITPKPKGGISYDWSGKEVTVKFDKGLEKNKTYLFVIGKIFKDIRNNSIADPVQFAVSTGPNIDKGKLSGKVYGNNFDRYFIFAYKYNPGESSIIDPSKVNPDYIMPVSADGNYRFENLSYGNYRLFSVFDNDLNGLYDVELEQISISDRDVEVSDTTSHTGVNFINKDLLVQDNFYSGKDFYKNLVSDSIGAVFTNLQDGDKTVGMLSRYYLYFKNRESSKEEITESIELKDTLNKKISLLYFWQNDSLLEVVPKAGLYYNAPLSLTLSYKKKNQPHKYKVNFTIADERKSGEISGLVYERYATEFPVIINLVNKNKREINFTRVLNTDSVFSFVDIAEGTYYLTALIDADRNGKYSPGTANPFKPGERIILYATELVLKGGWKIENVIVKF